MTQLYNDYSDLHRELDTHRGHQLGETNLVEVNRLLKAVQDKYAELFPFLHYVNNRSQFAENVAKSYNAFIDSLKKAGAQQEDEKETTLQ